MRTLTIFLCALAAACFCCAKHFERCELVQELRRQGFPEDNMSDWVCLVEIESGRQTNIIGPTNKDGTRDYGLFQINDKWWCNKGSNPGKTCNVTCGDLLTDDITIASNCAKKIYKRQKFYAWHGWRDYCQNKQPDISNCTASKFFPYTIKP